jgi:uncharacterized Tic20 family protein
MIKQKNFYYQPNENEAESASYSYLMSIIAIMVGIPLPIVNLVATLIFFLGNKKSSYFVRWHCTQALLSQITMFFINSIGFWWTISIIFTNKTVSTYYIVYLVILFLFNLIEFISSIYAAVYTRKGIHIHFWIYGNLSNRMCKH